MKTFSFCAFQLQYIFRCAYNIAGPDSSVVELTDFISAAQMSKEADADLGELLDEEKVISRFQFLK